VVDGNDEKDYLSCNVVLPLGENGVYTVYGVEPEKGRGPGRPFAWKFEYTLEDKRNSQTARIQDGEKVRFNRRLSLANTHNIASSSYIFYLLARDAFSLSGIKCHHHAPPRQEVHTLSFRNSYPSAFNAAVYTSH
jgi:hypothetical protein